MSNTSERKAGGPLSASAKLKLFLVLRRTLYPQRLKETLKDHLEWMAGQERIGAVFLSGPASSKDGTGPDGLTILRIADLDAANTLIRTDPLVAAGIVGVNVCEWTANEGCLSFSVTLSDSSCEFS
jgi:uncharacterized protein YciI